VVNQDLTNDYCVLCAMKEKQWEKAMTLTTMRRRGLSYKTKRAQTHQLKGRHQDGPCLLGQELFVGHSIEGF